MRRLEIVKNLLIILLVTGTVLPLFLGGMPDKLALSRIQSFLASFGFGQYVFIVFVTAVGVAAMVPSTLFTFISVSLYGPLVGFFLMQFGHNLGAAIAYHCSRFVVADKYLDRVERVAARYPGLDPGWVNLLIRLSVLPYSQVNYCVAMTPIGFWKYFLTTLIGGAPLTFLAALTYAGLLSALGLRSDFAGSSPGVLVETALFYMALMALPICVYRFWDKYFDRRRTDA